MIELTDEQKKDLLRFARKSIAEGLRIDTGIELKLEDFTDPVYSEKCGAFVTLHMGQHLRGCIGYIVGIKTIPEMVREMAMAAAFTDPRFPALENDEFETIDLEISVLTPIELVEDVSDIEVGRDGIIISRGFNQGLLLPQVATEQNWDRDKFLEQTCQKAGLPGNIWKEPGTKIEKFSALVFGEKELGMIE